MEIITSSFTDYEIYREEVSSEIRKSQESFVRIGYLLKVARDTSILEGSPYKNYLEFAAGEFGLEKTSVSRFININDRFSIGGNSDTMLPQFAQYGRAKLQEMLSLPDYINEELSPDLTKQEIADIRREVQEEEKVSDLEVMMEPGQKIELTLLEKMVQAMLEKNELVYKKIYEALKDSGGTELERILKDIYCPNGYSTHWSRPAGVGKCMVVFNDDEIIFTNTRDGQKTVTNWEEFSDNVSMWLNGEAETAEKSYESVFGIPWPENTEKWPEVAPVQQDKPDKIEESVRKNTENVAEKTENVPKTEENVQEVEENAQEVESNAQIIGHKGELEELKDELKDLESDLEAYEADKENPKWDLEEIGFLESDIEECREKIRELEKVEEFEQGQQATEVIKADEVEVVDEDKDDIPDIKDWDKLALVENAYESAQKISNILYGSIEATKQEKRGVFIPYKINYDTLIQANEELRWMIGEMTRREL